MQTPSPILSLSLGTRNLTDRMRTDWACRTSVKIPVLAAMLTLRVLALSLQPAQQDVEPIMEVVRDGWVVVIPVVRVLLQVP